LNAADGYLETLAPALPADVDALAFRVLTRLCDRNMRIATAESCTGGLIAAMFTDIQGCGHAFERGFIAYTEAAKHAILGVELSLIERDGVVSAHVARAMAEGGLARSEADLCIAVTGYADDAGGKAPAGLVHFALACRDGGMHARRETFGDLGRGGVRLACVRTALEMVADSVGA
jgi:nicotinamide-nucleotide amidase